MTIGEYNVKGFGLQFALYLEGIRVPFVGASVSSAPNRPSTCVIELPPFQSAAQIRPRTLVHLFYYDSPFKNTDFGELSGLPATHIPEWKLLFEGEVSHVDVVQNYDSRNITVVCQDFTNYWNHCYQFFINNQHGQAGSSTEIAVFTNGVDNQGPIAEIQTIYNVDFQGATGDIVLNSILKPGRRTVPLGLLDLLVKIGGEAAANPTGPGGVNRFFTKAETRLKMVRRVFMIPDPNIAEFVTQEAGSALAYIQQFTGSLSGLGTVNDVVRKFLGQCFYDYVNILAPPAGFNPSKDVTKTGEVNDDSSTFPANVKAGAFTILSTILKPKTFFLPPPLCNVFFPSRYTKFRYGQSFLDEPSRLRLKIGQGFPGDGVPFLQSGFQEMVVYAPPQAASFFSKTTTGEIDGTKTLAQRLSLGQPVSVADYQAVLRDYGANTQPPFNLVFDPSRAISEPETGIIPVFDTLDQTQGLVIGELSSTGLPPTASIQDKLQKLLQWGQNGTTYTETDSTDNENARNRLRYYLAAADYQLDVRKFGERSVSGIEGGFNPNLVVGFPCALLSSMGIFIGELASVTHEIKQTGTYTIAHMSHARQFPVPGFLSSLAPEQLAQISVDVANGIVDPVSGIVVNRVKDPITGGNVNITDRKAGDIPVFINENYTKPNIDLEVYSKVFGDARSIFNRIDKDSFTYTGAAGVGSDQYSAALQQYIDYLSADDKVGFVNAACNRNISSVVDVRAVYNTANTNNPIFQDDWYTLVDDEFLFDGLGGGPVFKDMSTGSTATKQEIIRNLTREMRISMGRQPGVSINIDSMAPQGNSVPGRTHRAGGTVGV